MKTKNALLRRLPALLAALILLFGLLPAASAEETLFYQSDFSRDEDGWFTFEPCQLYVKSKVLGIKGRTESWNSPRREFPLEPGETYWISVEVRQKQESSARFMVSAAHSKNGNVTYENIITGDAPKGKWTKLEGEWTPGAFDDFSLYVETVGSPALSYEIRDFRIIAGYSQGDRFMKAFDENSKKLKPVLDGLKASPYPDFMMASGRDLSAWIRQDELPETSVIQEVTLEGKVLSVTMDRKVGSIDVMEYRPNGEPVVTYVSSEDYKNKNRDVNATVTLKSPSGNTVEVTVSEIISVDGVEYRVSRVFALKPKGPELELKSSRISRGIPLKDYPPYDKVKNKYAYADYDVTLRADGSLSQIFYDFDDNAYLSTRMYLDENGQMDSLYVYKYCYFRGAHYSLDIRMDRNHRLTYWTATPGDDLSFTIYPLEKEYYDYYRPYIRETYPGLILSGSTFTVWAYDFDFGRGAKIRYFVTNDDLFIIDDSGVLIFNEEARDIKGNPFPDSGVMRLLDPAIYCFPPV